MRNFQVFYAFVSAVMDKREVLKTWELSLYELQRRPQEAVTEDTEIKINPRTLHSELMCPICLDVMSNTMTTKACRSSHVVDVSAIVISVAFRSACIGFAQSASSLP